MQSGLFGRMVDYMAQLRMSSVTKMTAHFERRFARLQELHGMETSDMAPELESCVHNLSSVILSPAELSVLNKGLSFAVTPKSIPRTEMIASVEAVIHGKREEEKSVIRKQVSSIMKRARIPKSNVSMEERNALSSLRRNEKIILLPGDKGNSIVVMNKDNYIEKLHSMITIGPYKKCKSDPGNGFRKFLYRELSIQP